MSMKWQVKGGVFEEETNGKRRLRKEWGFIMKGEYRWVIWVKEEPTAWPPSTAWTTMLSLRTRSPSKKHYLGNSSVPFTVFGWLNLCKLALSLSELPSGSSMFPDPACSILHNWKLKAEQMKVNTLKEGFFTSWSVNRCGRLTVKG